MNKYPIRWTLVACMLAAVAVTIVGAVALASGVDTTATVAVAGGAYTVVGTIAANLTTEAPGDSDVVKVVKQLTDETGTE